MSLLQLTTFSNLGQNIPTLPFLTNATYFTQVHLEILAMNVSRPERELNRTQNSLAIHLPYIYCQSVHVRLQACLRQIALIQFFGRMAPRMMASVPSEPSPSRKHECSCFQDPS
jgi:hypothetical protein